MARIAVCLLCVCVLAAASAYKQTENGKSQQQPVTVSPSGIIKGSWMETRKGRPFQAYRGIRYAEPPVGELRFQPPKLITSYKSEVDASEEGPSCPLIAPPEYYIDEDCLRLNVYTPDKNRSKRLPVVVYIHPGGFYSMTGRSDVVGPHYLLDRDVVLVSINYRLGSLGFLSTGDELAPGNNGFKDMVAALKWVQRNIAAFGGDPGLVTVAGCSAGSISAMLLQLSPMAKGLFHRAISMSASPTGLEPLPSDLYSVAVRQAKVVNCPTDNSTVIVDCLKKKPFRELGRSLTGFYEFGFDPVGIFTPVVEKDFGQERFLPIQPIDAIREQKMHAVPHIISQTTDEFFWKAFTITKNQTLMKEMNENWERIAPISFQLPRQNASVPARALRKAYFGDKPLKDDDSTARALGKLYGDGIIGFSTHRMANLMCRHSPHKVFYYEFAYIGNHSYYEDRITKKPTGAAHHDDTIYLFSQSYRFPTIAPNDADPDSRTVDRMTAMWLNFAKYGDPNPRDNEQPEISSLHWPAMTPSDRKYLRIGDELTVLQNMFEDRFNIWEQLYPIEY